MGTVSGLGNLEILFITASGKIPVNPSFFVFVDCDLFFSFVVNG